jgi:hypothetical protein
MNIFLIRFSAGLNAPHLSQGPSSSIEGGFDLVPHTQVPAPYPPLSPRSLPIAIELHDGNNSTVINTSQRSFITDNGFSSQVSLFTIIARISPSSGTSNLATSFPSFPGSEIGTIVSGRSLDLA